MGGAAARTARRIPDVARPAPPGPSGLAALPASLAPAPAAACRLHDYPVDVDAGDLFAHAPRALRAKWLGMAEGLAALARDAEVPVGELISRQIQDMGLSFRIAGDADEREWPLAAMPLLISAEEWAGVEAGLVQRAGLIEQVIADIYGPQSLVAEGALPAAAITGSGYFARAMVGRSGQSGPGKHYVQVYAADLARGPHGQWRVLGDRLRLATGIGYALENRLAVGRATGGLLGEIGVRRLSGFFADLRAGLAAECPRESPRLALLTPGRFNQSYPEQAHLARYLGFALVEGRDLTVSEGRLYVRTIAGPKRIDALWRWLDTNALDPLTFDTRSGLGVPDLFEAFAQGGVALANRPGVEVLEAPVFAAFLPRLARRLLGEDLLLPNIATWWCGQAAEAAHVAKALDTLMVMPAFGQPVAALPGTLPRPAASLSADERAALLAAMARRPMDYCAQEIVNLSTTPALIDDGFTPRAFTLRAFVARDGEGQWQVMPGGLARLSTRPDIFSTLMGLGDLSADVCVVDAAPQPGHAGAAPAPPAVQRGGGILASQAADNLFWFGRYLERAEASVRILRSVLGGSLEVDAAAAANAQLRRRLIEMLGLWGAIGPDALGLSGPEAVRRALGEAGLPGGVASLMANLRRVGLSLRDRFAPDFWRIASRPMPPADTSRPATLQRATRELIERFSALSGLIAEDMVRGPARHFLEIGRRLERAIATARIVRQLIDAEEQGDALSVLLDLADSQITYRARYLAAPARAPVIDLLVLDPENPRALVFQLNEIEAHLAALPRLADSTLPEAPLRAARAALAPLSAIAAEAVDSALLAATEAQLMALSEAISQRYFLQYEKSEGEDRAPLLA